MLNGEVFAQGLLSFHAPCEVHFEREVFLVPREIKNKLPKNAPRHLST